MSGMEGQDLGTLANDLFSELGITPVKQQERLFGLAGVIRIAYEKTSCREALNILSEVGNLEGESQFPEVVMLSQTPSSDSSSGLKFSYIAGKHSFPLPVPLPALCDNSDIFLLAIIEGINAQAGNPGDVVVYQQQIPPSCMRSVADYFVDRFTGAGQKP